MITIEEVTDFQRLSCLSKEWNSIVLAHQKEVSLTYEWIETLWEAHLKKGPVITLLFRNGKKLIAIIPLYKDQINLKGIKLSRLRPITNLHSHHGNLIIAERVDSVVAKLLKHIIANYNWDIFDPFFCTDSLTYHSLKRCLDANGLNYFLVPGPSSPYLTLSVPMEVFLKSKSRNFRSNLHRKEKKLRNAGNMTIERYTTCENLDNVIKEISQIEENSWKSKASTAITMSPKRMSFFYKLAKKAAQVGWLNIYILKIDGIPITYDYALIYNKTYYMKKTSYDERWETLSPGFVLRWYTIQEALKQGLDEYDFLGQSELYKLQWTDTVRKHNTVVIYNKNLLPTLFYYTQLVKRRLSQPLIGLMGKKSTQE